ncbi:MAG: glutathione synthase [Clostridia bacterium]|nr:glutathione synthase [Clostridia bacterium]
MKFDTKNKAIRTLLRQGEFGMEMESLRVNSDGTLAQTAHPFEGESNITRDFCENQTEMITDVFNSVSDMTEHLRELRSMVSDRISQEGELLWPFSNPPAFSSPDSIPIADFKGSVYRDYLAGKYGKVKMLLSGIHLNFSIPHEAVKTLAREKSVPVREFKDMFYLDLAAKLLSYSWLIVYLTAASPVMDETFVKFGGAARENISKYSSVRCGEAGYWNYFTPAFDFSSLDNYINSIERYIANGDIISCSELYFPIRVKPRGKYGTDTLAKSGINHIELRMIDLNPLSQIGVFEQDIEFIHLLILYLLSKDIPTPDESTQLDAINNMKTAALFGGSRNITIDGKTLPIEQAAENTLREIAEHAGRLYPEYLMSVNYQTAKLGCGGYSKIIRTLFADDYMQGGLALARRYQRSDLNVYAFCGKLKE